MLAVEHRIRELRNPIAQNHHTRLAREDEVEFDVAVAIYEVVYVGMDRFPQLEKFLNNGIPLLQAIGTGIGAFVGGIASGFAGAILDILPKLGTALSGFMDNVSGLTAVIPSRKPLAFSIKLERSVPNPAKLPKIGRAHV